MPPPDRKPPTPPPKPKRVTPVRPQTFTELSSGSTENGVVTPVDSAAHQAQADYAIQDAQYPSTSASAINHEQSQGAKLSSQLRICTDGSNDADVQLRQNDSGTPALGSKSVVYRVTSSPSPIPRGDSPAGDPVKAELNDKYADVVGALKSRFSGHEQADVSGAPRKDPLRQAISLTGVPKSSQQRTYSSGGPGSAPPLHSRSPPPNFSPSALLRSSRENIDTNSAAALPKTLDDEEEEDEFGYTFRKVQLRYADTFPDGKLDLVKAKRPVHKPGSSEGARKLDDLGLSLAGNRDLSKMSVFVVGIRPGGPAESTGKLNVGDQLLEVNGMVLYGRSHLNATAIIKALGSSVLQFVVLRRPGAVDEMAVSPSSLSPSVGEIPSSVATSQPIPPSDDVQTTVDPSTSHDENHSLTQDIVVPCSTNDLNDGGESGQNAISTAQQPTVPDGVQQTRVVTIRKGAAGYGVTLTEGIADEKLNGVFVTNISPESSAAQENELHLGDQVVSVNGKSIVGMSSAAVADMIQSFNQVDLGVASCNNMVVPPSSIDVPLTTAHSSTVYTTTSSPKASVEKRSSLTIPADSPLRKSSSGSGHNLAHAQIEPGVETLIEIDKGGKGLGLSIVGGKNTLLGAIAIHEVYQDGAAAKDGRLQPGDQVLEVNNESLRDVLHERAILILRQTPPRVKLLVYRDPNFQLSVLNPAQMYNVIEVELMKKPGKGLGLCIVGRKSQSGVYISEIVKGGVADQDGRLMNGDQILTVNGQDLTTAMQEHAAALLKTCMGKVILRVGRLKLGGGAGQRNIATSYTPTPTTPNVTRVSAPSVTVAVTSESLSSTYSQEPPTKYTNSEPLYSSPSEKMQQTAAGKTTGTTTATPITFPTPGEVTNGLPSSDHQPDSSTDTHNVSIVAPTTPALTNISPAEDIVTSTPQTIEASSASPVPPTANVTTTGSVVSLSAPSGSSGGSPMTDLVVPPPMLPVTEEGSEDLMVELHKVEHQQLGMGIGIRQRGVLVTSLLENSQAALHLKVSDRLMAVNGQEVVDQQSAVTFVRASGPHLFLQIARPKAAEEQSASPVQKPTERIILKRGPAGLGISIIGGGNDRHKNLPIYVKRVFEQGAAAADGRLKAGDQLVTVNGISLLGLTHKEAVALLKDAKDAQGRVVLDIIPTADR